MPLLTHNLDVNRLMVATRNSAVVPGNRSGLEILKWMAKKRAGNCSSPCWTAEPWDAATPDAPGQRIGRGGVELSLLAVLGRVRAVVSPTQAQVQGEGGRDLPVIFKVESGGPPPRQPANRCSAI